METKYQNSVCRPGLLHKFKQIRITDNGSLERCERCGLQMNFPFTIPNHIYISFHIRDILRSSDSLFSKEYPNLI